MKTIELLAPAKDLECGLAAINCGADAVYIGAPRFGARESAGNSLADIAALVSHAHKYWAKVYVTLNTLLRDDEVLPAVRLATQLYEAGIDGLIVQDTGLLERELPPLPLIASTQMNNATPEKVAFLEQVGFKRVILARELELGQIRAIRAAAPTIELECFIHGALCVCYSGQCYLSFGLGGRSGNRGQCAQPCRKNYTLVDGHDLPLASGHLLSLHDLNLSEHLGDLIEAGVSCFKIEGRLKDKTYVANVVAHYRARIDALLEGTGWRKSASGSSSIDFAPDPAKTFNRGATHYFLRGRGAAVASPETPKMTGEKLGRVVAVNRGGILIDTKVVLHPGDGLCYFGPDGELGGTVVNAAFTHPNGQAVTPEKLEGLEKGLLIYRNHDHEFLTSIKKSRMERRISVALTLGATPDGLKLTAEDEDGVRAEFAFPCTPEPAEKPELALANIQRQLEKMGGSDFVCSSVAVELEPVCFLPMSALNALRRGVLENLTLARAAQRPSVKGGIVANDAPYPETELTYLGNVLNRAAETFYRRHGVTRIEPAAESGLSMRGRKVMTTRLCLKHQLGACPKASATSNPSAQPDEPLTLIDEEGHRLGLRFNCGRCEMDIHLGRG